MGMHYYITRAETGAQACESAEYDIDARDVVIIGAVSEKGAYVNYDSYMSGDESIADAEIEILEMMDIHTAENRRLTDKIRGKIKAWFDDYTKLTQEDASWAAEYFEFMEDAIHYHRAYGHTPTFKDGLRFRQGKPEMSGATNTLEWSHGACDMWVVFIENYD